MCPGFSAIASLRNAKLTELEELWIVDVSNITWWVVRNRKKNVFFIIFAIERNTPQKKYVTLSFSFDYLAETLDFV